MMTGSEVCPFSSVKSKRHNEEFSKSNESDSTMLTDKTVQEKCSQLDVCNRYLLWTHAVGQ